MAILRVTRRWKRRKVLLVLVSQNCFDFDCATRAERHTVFGEQAGMGSVAGPSQFFIALESTVGSGTGKKIITTFVQSPIVWSRLGAVKVPSTTMGRWRLLAMSAMQGHRDDQGRECLSSR